MRIQAKLGFRPPAQVFEALKWLPDLSQIQSYGKLNTYQVDVLTQGFVMDSTVMIAVFLIRAFEASHIQTTQQSDELKYEDAEGFNDFWDESFGEFIMGDYAYTASEILFGLDNQAYIAEYNTFMDEQQEIEHEGES